MKGEKKLQIGSYCLSMVIAKLDRTNNWLMQSLTSSLSSYGANLAHFPT